MSRRVSLLVWMVLWAEVVQVNAKAADDRPVYGTLSVLPICTQEPRPEMFSHPVEVERFGTKSPGSSDSSQGFTVRWKNWRDPREMADLHSGKQASWIDFGDPGRLFHLGDPLAVLDCRNASQVLGGEAPGVAFEVSALPVGRQWTLMRMQGRLDPMDSMVRGQVRVSNQSHFFDAKSRTVSGDDFIPGVVNLVLSYSLDGTNFIEAGRSTTIVPSAFSRKAASTTSLEVKSIVPGPAQVRLDLIFHRFKAARLSNQLNLIDARLFTAACVPDQTNPGQCL